VGTEPVRKGANTGKNKQKAESTPETQRKKKKRVPESNDVKKRKYKTLL
jgi:hypothetical protein